MDAGGGVGPGWRFKDGAQGCNVHMGPTKRWAPPSKQLLPPFNPSSGQSSVPHQGVWLTRPTVSQPRLTATHKGPKPAGRRLDCEAQGHPQPSPKPVGHFRSLLLPTEPWLGGCAAGLPGEQAGSYKTSLRVLLWQALGAWSCGKILACDARGRGFNAGSSPGAFARDQERNRSWQPPAGWSPILSNLGRAV